MNTAIVLFTIFNELIPFFSVPTPSTSKKVTVTPVDEELKQGLGIVEISQIVNLIETLNGNSKCKTRFCRGILVPIKIDTKGKACGVEIKWICNGCDNRDLVLSPSLVPDSRRSIISLSTTIASLAAGLTYADYFKVFEKHMGMDALTSGNFYTVIQDIHTVVEEILDEQCEINIEKMKELPKEEYGSFEKAITTSDGVWLTRGYHSQNFTFTIWNYLNHGLLYYLHLCQRGGDNIIEEELYGGTAKSAEGYAAQIAFKNAKEDGMNIQTNWQDADSTSGSAFKESFPEESSKLMLCGGHVNRAHSNQLKEMASKKVFTKAYISLHKKKFPEIESVECCCAKRGKHKKECGCLTGPFLDQGRINFFSALKEAGTDPDKFKTILMQLADHHSKDEHVWEGGKCLWHDTYVCGCDPKCETCANPVPYKTRSPLTCELHHLAYRIELHHRASMSDQIIHPHLGKGHSNIPESAHNVLTCFRAKDQNILRLHYNVSTNMGLLEANQPFMMESRGNDYHWIKDLYSRLNLPIFPGVIEALAHANERRQNEIMKHKTEEFRSKKLARKQGRKAKQAAKKKWMDAKKIHHSYGTDAVEREHSESGDSDDDVQEANDGTMELTVHGNASRKAACKRCGKTDHLRSSSKKCEFNKANLQTI